MRLADRKRFMTTILICPQCATRYETVADIPAEGRKVRCSQCGTIWHVMSEHDPVGEAASAYKDEAGDAGAGPASAGVQPPEPPLDDDEIVFRPEGGGTSAAAGLSTAVKQEPWPLTSPERRGLERPEARPKPVAFGIAPAPPVGTGVLKPPASIASREPLLERSGRARVLAGWAALGVVIIGIGFVLFAAPEAVVRALPGTARLYAMMGIAVNLRGLAFDKVAYDWIDEGGRQALDVTGEIVNLTQNAIEPPPVLFALRDDKSAEVFQWAARVREQPLAAGERAEFSARIPSPPGAVRSLEVRFARGE